uniref:Polypeptide N-acetylgalactosaminyltransferase n=1 Tax=Geotrypetes seraphini TaxID=260995 RepID=A0A6P8P9L0_GEOSA|nr:polypeptide N-acetylgalactosaminyltransferase 6-like [Geotrypetes seraphini]
MALGTAVFKELLQNLDSMKVGGVWFCSSNSPSSLLSPPPLFRVWAMAPPRRNVSWLKFLLFLCILSILMVGFMKWLLSQTWGEQPLSQESDFNPTHATVHVTRVSSANSTLQCQSSPPQEIETTLGCPPGHYSVDELQPHFRRPLQDAWFPGAGGRPYRVSDLTSEEEIKRNMGYVKYNLNAFVSDRISLLRDLGPDTRPPECLEKKFKRCPALSPVSVIIIFHNEARSTLLRTVYSVLYTVPRFLLLEIILVDDASTNEDLKTLDEYLRQLPLVRLLQQPVRKGLVGARLLGAEQAKADVLVFLDAHCECWSGWLEPLLERIALDNTLVVSPDIAFINPHTFQFERPVPKPSSHSRGTFDWSLVFMFEPLPQALEDMRMDETQPFPTPAIAGGIFAISKSFFQHIGTYDPDMQIWGGENLEISLKVWMCGGKLEIVPCSVVGHIYRMENPHIFPEESSVVSRNLVRVAEVWMDEYKVLFYRRNMEAARIFKEKSYGDLSQRHQLREQLGCKSFGWYMNTVRSDFFIPDLNPHFYGALANLGLTRCLDVGELKDGKAEVGTSICRDDPVTQYFEYSSLNEIRHNIKNELCLSVAQPSVEHPVFTFQACVAKDGERNVPPHQAFSYDKDGLIWSQKFDLCLQAERYALFLASCDSEEDTQLWDFVPVLPK